MELLIAIVNVVITGARLLSCARAARFMTIVWFLVFYFSIFMIPLSLEHEINHYRAFRGEYVMITAKDIAFVIRYAFIFNLIFLAADILLGFLIYRKSEKSDWLLPSKVKYFKHLQYAYGAILCLGTAVYFYTTRGHTYIDFVEYKGSNWGQVFLMAGAPFVTIAALRKKYLVSILACIPFLYFGFILNIRSFALLSIVPLSIIYVLQVLSSPRKNHAAILRQGMAALLLAVFVLGVSTLIIVQKRGLESVSILDAFPDSGMPYGAAIMITLIEKYHVNTGLDSLILYGNHFVVPFEKLFGIESPDIVDPPAVMAAIYDGISKNWDVYYHYPALWYADAYISFGKYGVWLAAFWALIFLCWERLLSRNIFLFFIFLPYFSWQVYMIVRGATAGSSVPFAYAAYIAFFIPFIVSFSRAFKLMKSGNKFKRVAANRSAVPSQLKVD